MTMVLSTGYNEVRSVKRKLLVETLAKNFQVAPLGTPKVVSKEESGFLKLVQLAHGFVLKTK